MDTSRHSSEMGVAASHSNAHCCLAIGAGAGAAQPGVSRGVSGAPRLPQASKMPGPRFEKARQPSTTSTITVLVVALTHARLGMQAVLPGAAGQEYLTTAAPPAATP